jgi:hypothetical protein
VIPQGGGLNVSESSKSAILNSRLGPTSSTEKQDEGEEVPVITAWQTSDRNLVRNLFFSFDQPLPQL